MSILNGPVPTNKEEKELQHVKLAYALHNASVDEVSWLLSVCEGLADKVNAPTDTNKRQLCACLEFVVPGLIMAICCKVGLLQLWVQAYNETDKLLTDAIKLLPAAQQREAAPVRQLMDIQNSAPASGPVPSVSEAPPPTSQARLPAGPGAAVAASNHAPSSVGCTPTACPSPCATLLRR